jgi:nucleotide-binding universal stress UspA family protein
MTSGATTSRTAASARASANAIRDVPDAGLPWIARIAVGVDGFPEGEDAATLGHALAQATGAELMLVAVHSAPLLPAPPELSYASLRKQSQLVLREARDSLAPEARTVTTTDPSVAHGLHRIVQRHHRDLLVVGSSRLGPDGQVRIGKRTRQLLCQFECALAVAPRGMHSRTPRLERIGVGYDGGTASEAALALAGSIARGAGAELHIQAVVDDRLPAFAWPTLSGVLWTEVIHDEVDRVRGEALAAGRRTASKIDVDVALGRPADALLALSERVDLLIIGSRRWGPTARLLLGSTGEALMHDAACPVLAVPRPPG